MLWSDLYSLCLVIIIFKLDETYIHVGTADWVFICKKRKESPWQLANMEKHASELMHLPSTDPIIML